MSVGIVIVTNYWLSIAYGISVRDTNERATEKMCVCLFLTVANFTINLFLRDFPL